MTFCETALLLAEPPQATASRTLVVTVLAPCEIVFNTLADIENLPRWAGEFCEQLFLSNGRWKAFTSLGELYLALEANEAAGEIVLFAGWAAAELRPLKLSLMRGTGDSTRVKFALEAGADAEHERLHAAVEAELPNLIARLGGRVAAVAACA